MWSGTPELIAIEWLHHYTHIMAEIPMWIYFPAFPQKFVIYDSKKDKMSLRVVQLSTLARP